MTIHQEKYIEACFSWINLSLLKTSWHRHIIFKKNLFKLTTFLLNHFVKQDSLIIINTSSFVQSIPYIRKNIYNEIMNWKVEQYIQPILQLEIILKLVL